MRLSLSGLLGGLVLLLSGITTFGHAGLNVWTSSGPDGQGDVSALAIDPTNPSIIYAGSFGGIFKSKDGGDTWSPASSGLVPNPGIYDEGGGVYTLAVDPVNPNTVYAGTMYEGAFKSTDGGASWSAINSGLTGQLVFGLAIDSTTPSTVYAATLDDGVFKTIDGGANWSAANNGLSLSDDGYWAVVIDPTSPSTLYVGASSGVYKSTDGAASWSALTGLPGNVGSLAIDPQTPSTLYAGTQLNGVFKSTDGAASWNEINTGLTDIHVSSVAVDPKTPSKVYVGSYYLGAGLFRSANGGASWSPVNIGTDAAIAALAVDPENGTAYAGTWRGFFRSATGATWHASNTGLSNTWASVVAVDPATPSRVYAGTLDGGLFKSTNGAASWTAASKGLVYDEVDAIAIDPATPTTLYAAPSLFKSTNGAASWSSAYTGLGSSAGVLSIAIDPATPSTLYAGTFDGGVFKSTNAAGSWVVASNGLTTSAMITALAIDPATPTTLYAGWRENFPFVGSVFKSVDAAGNWNPANNGMPSNAEVFALAIDPATPTTLYAAALFGVFKSVDGAGSWNHLPVASLIYAVAIDPSDPSIVYAGTGTEGVFKSTDGGASWNPFNAGLSTLFVVGLAVDPTNSTTVYAATRGGGVFSITQTDPMLDHFTCYKSGATRGSVKFPGIESLPLRDEFGPASVEVKKPPFLCAPTDKNGENLGAETHSDHLEGYGIKNPAMPALATKIMVVDQFNPRGLFVDAKKVSHLMVPTVKDLATPPPLPGAFSVDHFACYKVKASKDKPKFTPVLGLPIEDQFGTMTVNVKKPKYLCNPVDKNGEDPSAPTHPGHLMCYQVKQADLAKFVKKVGVFVNNQFGPETLDVKKPSELCVPALKNP